MEVIPFIIICLYFYGLNKSGLFKLFSLPTYSNPAAVLIVEDFQGYQKRFSFILDIDGELASSHIQN